MIRDKKNDDADVLSPEDIEQRSIGWWLMRLSPKQILAIAVVSISVLSTAFALGAWISENKMKKGEEPEPVKTNPDSIRFILASVIVGLNTKPPLYTTASLSVSNISGGQILINSVNIGLSAISKSDGSVLGFSAQLLKNENLKKDEIKPVDSGLLEVRQWRRMGNVVNVTPSPDTHFFKILVQVIATDGSGKPIWLEVETDLPAPMNCGGGWCLGMLDLNIPAGRVGYRKCSAYPMSPAKKLICFSQDDSI
jgi:hypothetical protein